MISRQPMQPVPVADRPAMDPDVGGNLGLQPGGFGHQADRGLDEARAEGREIGIDPVAQDQDRARLRGQGHHLGRAGEARQIALRRLRPGAERNRRQIPPRSKPFSKRRAGTILAPCRLRRSPAPRPPKLRIPRRRSPSCSPSTSTSRPCSARRSTATACRRPSLCAIPPRGARPKRPEPGGMSEAPQAGFMHAEAADVDPRLAQALGLRPPEDGPAPEGLGEPGRHLARHRWRLGHGGCALAPAHRGQPAVQGRPTWVPHRPERPKKSEGGVPFTLKSEFEPAGDQPRAIAELVEGVKKAERDQVLLASPAPARPSPWPRSSPRLSARP